MCVCVCVYIILILYFGYTSVDRIPRECAAVVLELKNLPSPKSPSFTTADAVTNTLAGLISVCVCIIVFELCATNMSETQAHLCA